MTFRKQGPRPYKGGADGLTWAGQMGSPGRSRWTHLGGTDGLTQFTGDAALLPRRVAAQSVLATKSYQIIIAIIPTILLITI